MEKNGTMEGRGTFFSPTTTQQGFVFCYPVVFFISNWTINKTVDDEQTTFNDLPLIYGNGYFNIKQNNFC